MSIDYRRYEHQIKDWLLSNAIHAPMAEVSADVSRSRVLADVLMYPIRRYTRSLLAADCMMRVVLCHLHVASRQSRTIDIWLISPVSPFALAPV